MTYVGSPVTKATLPGDYDSQLRKIIFDMESVGVRHNDIIYPCSAAAHICSISASLAAFFAAALSDLALLAAELLFLFADCWLFTMAAQISLCTAG